MRSGSAGIDRIIVAPVHAARIDHHRKAVRPRSRQRRPKEHLSHRFNGHLETASRGQSAAPRARSVHDHRRRDRVAAGQPHAAHHACRRQNLRDSGGDELGARLLGGMTKPKQDLARVRVTIVGTEDAENDVVDHEIGHENADVVAR